MADKTHIEWTDATWNPITGCSVVSPGCTNCYAMKLAGGRLKHHPSRTGLTQSSKAGPVWNGKVRFNDNALFQPLRWRRPRRIFVCAHGDLFHETVPDLWIDKVFAVMAMARQHQFQVLTKRSQRMRQYFATDGTTTAKGRIVDILSDRWDRYMGCAAIDDTVPATFVGNVVRRPDGWPLPNVWLGVSVEDQHRANERIPLLCETPAAVRFLSCEPLLEEIEVFSLNGPIDLPDGVESPIHWIIVGGESGPGARPMHPNWARSLRDQCAAANVPFFFKQHGDWLQGRDLEPGELAGRNPAMHAWTPPHGEYGEHSWRVGKKRAGRILDGRTWDEMPVIES